MCRRAGRLTIKLTVREADIHRAGGPVMGHDTALFHIHPPERRRTELALRVEHPRRDDALW